MNRHCVGCDQPKPAESFKGRYCRECRRERDREYYQANREKILARVCERQKDNPEYAAYQATYRAEHREENLAYQQEYREENGDRLRAYDRERYSDPERRRRHYLTQQVPRRALCRKDVITPEAWDALLAFCGHRCLACGATEDLELDHVVPLTRGGRNCIENAQPLCSSCNKHKMRASSDFRTEGQREYAEALAKSHRRNRRSRS